VKVHETRRDYQISSIHHRVRPRVRFVVISSGRWERPQRRDPIADDPHVASEPRSAGPIDNPPAAHDQVKHHTRFTQTARGLRAVRQLSLRALSPRIVIVITNPGKNPSHGACARKFRPLLSIVPRMAGVMH